MKRLGQLWLPGFNGTMPRELRELALFRGSQEGTHLSDSHGPGHQE